MLAAVKPWLRFTPCSSPSRTRCRRCCLRRPKCWRSRHFLTLSNLLRDSAVRIDLFTGRTKRTSRSTHLLADGTIHLAVGTQALIQEDIDFANLGLVVIDEQHKLGVRQRAVLKSKGYSPHYLVMYRHADSANARALLFCRLRHVGDRRPAAWTPADHHALAEIETVSRCVSISTHADQSGPTGVFGAATDRSGGRCGCERVYARNSIGSARGRSPTCGSPCCMAR